jgi:gamma-glutamyl:cysteine ligase YbdK (ATP-grasp superfamily)
VTLGLRYVDSIIECFHANIDRFPPLLPQVMNEPPERLAHLRLHNGTVWRWNRPLIGFDDNGSPHLRIEHRVVPAGPTVADSIANAALYFGAVQSLAAEIERPERRLPFAVAKTNFYSAARDGLAAEVEWLDGHRASLRRVLLDELLPRARQGLLDLDIDVSEADLWLGIIEGRLRTGQTGAAWQREWVKHEGADFEALTAAYLERQQSGRPVHEWIL